MESLTRAEKIAILDKKLLDAKAGKDIAFTYEENKKLYGRLNTAVNGPGEGPARAREALDEIQNLPKGKEKAKRALLNAWPGSYFSLTNIVLPSCVIMSRFYTHTHMFLT